MKQVILIFSVELLISAAFAFSLNTAGINYDFFTALGLGNLIIGVVGGIIGLIILATNNKKTGKYFLIASGLLLLAGCLTCAAFPILINGRNS